MMRPGTAPVREGDLVAGKYRVERVLGAGGMGIVVAARHEQLDQMVAIKFVRDDALDNDEAVARFLREARAAVKLKSEHVARVLDVGKLESGAPYMVMEYLEGSDLAKVLADHGRMATDTAADWILQACEAVAEAHAAGIVHRDLKPENLFLMNSIGGAQKVKVLDFGVSKAMGGASGELSSLTRTRAMLGSPLYMAPEQMRSSRDVDARVDIWALGVVLFQLLTQRWPFEADTMPELCLKVVTEPPLSLATLRPDAPPGLVAVVERCIEKDPSKRFANAAELATALEPFALPSSRLLAERARLAMEARASRTSVIAVSRAVGGPDPRSGALGASGSAVVSAPVGSGLTPGRAPPAHSIVGVTSGASARAGSAARGLAGAGPAVFPAGPSTGPSGASRTPTGGSGISGVSVLSASSSAETQAIRPSSAASGTGRLTGAPVPEAPRSRAAPVAIAALVVGIAAVVGLKFALQAAPLAPRSPEVAVGATAPNGPPGTASSASAPGEHLADAPGDRGPPLDVAASAHAAAPPSDSPSNAATAGAATSGPAAQVASAPTVISASTAPRGHALAPGKPSPQFSRTPTHLPGKPGQGAPDDDIPTIR